ncbi:MAG: putative membrane protein YdjX (TVP38/TMEM64 family) [Myxococcota bacterium]|jgi:uncharacterized membrane protein YdjX (TVP38/TMEM64 family)
MNCICTRPSTESPRFSLHGMTGRQKTFLRLGALVGVLVTLFVVAMATGVTDSISIESLRDAMLGAGALGVVLFLLAFAGAQLVYLPGMLFVVAAILAYGQVAGAALGLAGAVLSVAVSFTLVRAVGGKALAEVKRPMIRKMLDRLEKRPIMTVALLRLAVQVSPPVNYALALSNVSFRAHLIGSAIGLIIPIGLASIFVDALV